MTALSIYALAVLTACEKEPVISGNTAVLEEVIAKQGQGVQPKRHFFDHGGDNYGCTTPAVECLDDVVVTPSMQQVIDDVYAAVLSGDVGGIQAVFAQHRTSLSTVMNVDDVDGVINRDLLASLRGPKSKWYLLLRAASGG